MNPISEILRALGRIEGRLDQLACLDQRVSQLELWQAWLKGGWATLAAGLAWLYIATYAK